jgi:hypothetical protein
LAHEILVPLHLAALDRVSLLLRRCGLAVRHAGRGNIRCLARGQALHEDCTNQEAVNGRSAPGDALVAGGIGGSPPPQKGYGILLH